MTGNKTKTENAMQPIKETIFVFWTYPCVDGALDMHFISASCARQAANLAAEMSHLAGWLTTYDKPYTARYKVVFGQARYISRDGIPF